MLYSLLLSLLQQFFSDYDESLLQSFVSAGADLVEQLQEADDKHNLQDNIANLQDRWQVRTYTMFTPLLHNTQHNMSRKCNFIKICFMTVSGRLQNKTNKIIVCK